MRHHHDAAYHSDLRPQISFEGLDDAGVHLIVDRISSWNGSPFYP